MPYKQTNIKLSETGWFSKLFIDYLAGDDKLKPFYTYPPDAGSFAGAIEARSKLAINREVLADVISGQYKERLNGNPGIELTIKNIDLLREKNTYTVCTGHQLCLFTGPLYFVFKIISTINLAETLKKKYPEFNFVPVYWMASEDHDFEEVRSVNLFGKTLRWEHPSPKGAVGRLNTGSLAGLLDELSAVLGDSANARELMQVFRNAYAGHDNLADATRYLVHSLFAEYGLVIIDPDDKRLKEEFSDIIKDDIQNNTNFRIVNETIKQLDVIGIKPQVNPREINLFRLGNDRTRIENSDADKLSIPVEEYSPNVVLRPLYQQMILPNLAYVGGPGELAYWLEFKAMFDHHNILFPVLVPRNFAMLLDSKSDQQLQKMGFDAADLFKDHEVLIKEYIGRHTENELSLHEQEAKITGIYNEIAVKVIAVDQSLKGSVEAELQKTLHSLKNIEGKLLRAEKQKQETGINTVKKLKDRFFPGGNLQERYDNFSPLYLKHGKELISGLKESFDPFKFEMLILEIN